MGSDAERFWVKVDLTGDCWEWTASKNKKGYGRFRFQGETRLAHRVAYEMIVGPIPFGLTLDHLCRNHGCVRPEHLEPVTQRVNVERGDGLAALARTHISKTHCPKNHPYDEGNTRVTKQGWRRCRTCENAANLARYHARKAGV